MTKQHATYVGDPTTLIEMQQQRLLVDRAFGTVNAVELDRFYIKAFSALDHEDGIVLDVEKYLAIGREDDLYFGPDPEYDF